MVASEIHPYPHGSTQYNIKYVENLLKICWKPIKYCMKNEIDFGISKYLQLANIFEIPKSISINSKPRENLIRRALDSWICYSKINDQFLHFRVTYSAIKGSSNKIFPGFIVVNFDEIISIWSHIQIQPNLINILYSHMIRNPIFYSIIFYRLSTVLIRSHLDNLFSCLLRT